MKHAYYKNYIRLKFLAYAIFVFCLMRPVLSNAQVFPVNATPQVIPPYSLKLSEYGTSFSEKLILNILLTDITELNRQVDLKFYVENNSGLAIRSSDVVIGATPIFLDGGTPLRLSNSDLRAYFEFQNLTGITPQQYSVPLPEGLYRFCFEVFDARSGQQISRKSCATVYLALNDPPFLNLPNRAEQVLMREPQNIIFQWTPRHLNATNVEYEFTLAELWDIQMDPQAAFMASRPLYQTTTFSNTLLYGPGETPLLPDKTYAWRVRAMVNDGISETSMFKNNGFSEIYHFTYTGNCAEPEYVLAEAQNTTTEKIHWQSTDHKRFNVQYRKKGAESSIWFDSPTVNSYTTIYNLEPGTGYQFRVGGQCMDNGPFTYSQIFEFTTNISTDQGANFNCGITPEIVIHNHDPLTSLVINETFTAGDFPVTVKEVNGANGRFSGWGYIVVPYLEDTKLKVSFDNIRINTEYQLLEGIVITDYDKNWGGVDDIGDEIAAITDVVDTISDEVAAIIDEVFGTDDGNDDTESGNTAFDSEADYTTPNTENDPDSTNTSNENDDSPATGNTNNTSNNSETTNDATSSDSDTSSESPTEVDEVFIVYNGKQYKHGDVIEVPYHKNNSHFAFSLKSHSENSTFNWQVLYMGTDNTSVYAQNETIHDNFGIDMKNILKLDVVANYNDKKIQVTIQRKSEKFKLLELYALHGEKRLAKSGQILYLVNPPSVTKDTKNVKYGLSINPDIDENLLSRNSIKWSYDGENQYFPTARTNVTRSLQESDNIITTTVTAGNPNALIKSVDVDWVNEDKKTYKVVPSAVQFTIEEIFKNINRVKEFSEKFGKYGIDIKPKISFSGIQFNQEDDETRFYLTIRDGGVDAEVGMVYDVPLPPPYSINLTIPIIDYKVAEIGAFLKINSWLKVGGKLRYEKRNDKSEFVKTRNTIELGATGGVEFGAKVEVLPGVENIVFYIKAFGKASLTANGRLNFNSDSTYEFKPKVFFEPLVGGFNGQVKAGDITIFDQSFEWRLLEKKQIYP